jgi:uncharacterized membrane protein YfcA
MPTPPRASAGAALPKVLLAGTAVGLMTGFFGVGGGFVIVPALVLTMGFSMPDAVGTSLVVIAINSAMALGLRAGTLDIHWGDALPFLVLAIIGTVLGKRIADRVPASKLTNRVCGAPDRPRRLHGDQFDLAAGVTPAAKTLR